MVAELVPVLRQIEGGVAERVPVKGAPEDVVVLAQVIAVGLETPVHVEREHGKVDGVPEHASGHQEAGETATDPGRELPRQIDARRPRCFQRRGHRHPEKPLGEEEQGRNHQNDVERAGRPRGGNAQWRQKSHQDERREHEREPVQAPTVAVPGHKPGRHGRRRPADHHGQQALATVQGERVGADEPLQPTSPELLNEEGQRRPRRAQKPEGPQ